MATTIRIQAADGATVEACLATPPEEPVGAIVLVQEIFGITDHIRSVADRLAALGYTTIAPAFFDRIEPDTVLAYDAAGTQRGVALAKKLGVDAPLQDVAAAVEQVRDAGKVGIIGFCWGGTIALLGAQRLALPAVSYYGARNKGWLDQPLQAPAMFHFGGKDGSIPANVIAEHRRHYPEAPVHVYPEAGHAFNRDVDGDPHYNEASARLAWKRTLAFLAQHVGA